MSDDSAAMGDSGVTFEDGASSQSRRTLLKGMTAGAAGLLFTGAAQAAGSGVLLVKNCEPWNSNGTTVEEHFVAEGVSFTKITSDQFAGQDLSGFGVIATESTQDATFYSDMYASRTKLANWVSGGGLLLGNLTIGGYPCTVHSADPYLPGNVGVVENYFDSLHIVESGHPSVSGLTDSDVSDWNSSTHGWLTNLPAGTTTVIERTDNGEAVLAEYGHGDGTVLATTMTLEWGDNDPTLLQQTVTYMTDGAGYEEPAPEPEPEPEDDVRGPFWEVADFSVSDRPTVGQEVTFEVTIENVGDREGTYIGFLNDGFTRFGTTKRPEVEAGETATMTFTDSFEEAGTHRMFIRHDWIVDVDVSE